jgi:DNA-binding response OmpR family regulator
VKRKILLADDSATIQKVIELCFADEPFEVQAVQDGDQAQELIRSWQPDILLADVLMPGMDGYGLCRMAKRENHIPVILLVGTFEPFDFARAEEAGYDTYLTKPFDTAQLTQTVKGLVRPFTSAEIRRLKRVLHFDEEPSRQKTTILSISDFRLNPWNTEIVPQPEPRLPPLPVHRSAKVPASEGMSRDVEADVAAAIDRLMPRWMETVRRDLVEELKRRQ